MSQPGAAIAERPSLRAVVLLGFMTCATACGSRVVPLPDDVGAPLPDFATIHQDATRICRGVRTLEGQIALRGSAGDQGLRASVLAGFERPDSMRLEVLGAFGGVEVRLAAREGRATLLLTSDNLVVRDAPPGDVLGALTGVNLAPADVLAVLTGCVMPAPEPTAGRLHANGWASIDIGGGAVVYLERSGEWRIRAARRDAWRIDYEEWEGLFPGVVRLQSLAARPAVEVTATLSRISSNGEIPQAAFTLNVPEDAEDVTVDELRAIGPLGEEE